MFNNQCDNSKISVCLPVFNGEKYLEQAIESVLAQTFENFELLIADDASTDGSSTIIARYAASDARIKSWANQSNVGLFQNYNECMRKARGNFIKPFAQDDCFDKSILERMQQVLEDKPSVALVSCAKQWIGPDNQVIEAKNDSEKKILTPFDQDTYLSATEAIVESLDKFINWLGEPCSVMFRREHIGYGFDTRFKQIGDLEYSYRLLQNGDYYFLSDRLCSFRKHLESTTNKNNRSLSALLDWFVLGSKYSRYIEKMGESESEFAQRLTRRLIKTISTRFTAQTQNQQIDTSFVLKQLTDFPSPLSCFTVAADKRRNEEAEFKVFSVLALKEGANLLNEVRHAQNVVAHQTEQIADLKTELGDVRTALNQEIIELRQALSEVGNSVSWKVTAPLRGVKKLLP
jgi:glycosyltransferase involved in cell wall biosynthesis